MDRCKFENGKQRQFFQMVFEKSGLSYTEIAAQCSVSERTLRDWRREKFFANYDAVIALGERFGVSVDGCERMPARWHLPVAASRGGFARHAQYGLLGSLDDRRKGGKVSQERRRNDPERYRELGCKVRKNFPQPLLSEKLAELVGILLGDGALTDYHVRVTLNRIVDREYALFVQRLMRDVFVETPVWSERKGVIDLTLAGAELVDILETFGLVRGNKVAHQVSIPDWIFSLEEYQRACLRGLFDTDGGLYTHRKQKNTYIGWTFCSHSRPIVDGVKRILHEHSFTFSEPNRFQLYMYALPSIQRYFSVIGSHNPKNQRKIQQYCMAVP